MIPGNLGGGDRSPIPPVCRCGGQWRLIVVQFPSRRHGRSSQDQAVSGLET